MRLKNILYIIAYLCVFFPPCLSFRRNLNYNLYLYKMQRDNGWHTDYIYILTNKKRTVLYTGVTNNLSLRLFQHASNANPKSFISKYKCYFLIY
ncbi:GIY-YIG nuclease family protein [Chryseobacterium salipaludis]|uniref:GIY-YIG nuclease family protein n=2 Tax=Chryseobacterium TaxID=59732 RepID=UPI002B252E88|nr:GIY-YIG nuclease family protein [Planobacterium sp. JC490]